MQRRRGATLERAILDAAWEELADNGYAGFTVDGVVRRAGTSKPVVYRRWTDRGDLLRAAVAHVVALDRLEVPDTGTLRGDVLAVMRNVNETRLRLVTVMSVHLGDYYRETGSTPSDLRETVTSERWSGLEEMFARAAERGEVDLARLGVRVRWLAFDLLRHDLLMTNAPLTQAAMEEIVDTVFLPLALASTQRE